MTYIFMFLLGLLLAAIQPPLGFWPIVLISVPLFLQRLTRFKTAREALLKSWIYGFGYFCGVLHWIGFAFFENAAEFLWMMPFAVGGLAAVMALYWAAAGLVTWLLHKRHWPAWITYPALLAIGENLRGRLMTGFPWAAPGLAADEMGGVAQLASLVGMTGLTLMIMLWGGAAFALLKNNMQRRERIAALIILSLLPASWLWGTWRLEQNPTLFRDDVAVRLVQPNFRQNDQWRLENVEDNFEILLAATNAPSTLAAPITHVIWPESIVPFLLDESENALGRLKPVLAQGRVLLAGSMRRSSPAPDAKYFTSIIVIDQNADVVDRYDKWRLVPGGEFLPFEWILQPLGFRRVVALPESFGSGEGPRTVSVPGAGDVGMLICYEVVFPHNLVNESQRPGWLANVTNDGWFGKSVGPHQHLSQTRMRAIEQGLPIMRAANTGISVAFDPLGRTIVSTGQNVETFVDSKLPIAIPLTLYGQLGDIILAIMLLMLLPLARFFARRLR